MARTVWAIVLRLGLLALSLVAVLGALEIGLRLFWDGFYVKRPQEYAELHPVRGWSNRPGVSVVFAAPEFHTIVSHNAWGYRGAPVEPGPSPDRTRILVLGDSFAYGQGVEDDETFSAQLERLLPDVEVINTGVAGYGTSQQLLVLRDEGLCFHPRVVIVTFFWNDISDNLKGNAPRFSFEAGVLSYPPEDLPVILPEPPDAESEEEERRAWLRHSHAYRFLSDRTKLLRFRLRALRGIPVDETLVADEAAWAFELALLGEIERLSREAGARMLLLVIPDQLEVQADVRAESFSPEDYAVQERLRDFASELGIPMLDALPLLSAAYESDGEPLYYLKDRHLRARGHAIVAAELAERLLELGWLGPSRDEEPVPVRRLPTACPQSPTARRSSSPR